MPPFDLLNILQEESRKEKCIIFPNAKYEIENQYFTQEGIEYLINHNYSSNPYSIFSKNSNKKFEANVSYNIEIKRSPNEIFFTLWNSKKLIKVFFPDISKYFIGPESYKFKIKLIDELIEKNNITVLLEAIKYLASISEINPPIDFIGVTWATSFNDIRPSIGSIENIINELGLNYYCNNFEYSVFFGIQYQIIDIIYKPNITSYPSSIAYCACPHPTKNGWGSTLNLANLNICHPECIYPNKYFNELKIMIENLYFFKLDNEIDLIETNAIKAIDSMLQYDPTRQFKIDAKMNPITNLNSITFHELI